ncbi:MAG: DUF4388 domain-containing protein [Acidimicrobiia bacterium]|jgi:hypothetical protein
MLEGQNLSGQLSDWSISDLLQIMQVTKKTGSLDIEGERRGRVHFVDGAVTGAELAGAKGSYRGTDRGAIADILYVLSTLDSGSFGVGPADGPEADGFAVEDVMSEVDALRSLEGEVIDAGLFEAAGVRLVHDLDEPITMQPEDWAAIGSLVQPFTFDYLEARVGRGGAVRIFHTLHRLGVAEAIEADDDESAWLDRLADGLSSQTPEPTWLEEVPEESTPKHAAPDSASDPAVDEPKPEPASAEPEPTPVPEPEPEPVMETEPEPAVQAESEPVTEPAPEPAAKPEPEVAVPPGVRGVSAPASTTLTDGVYDEIRRLRSKVSDGK